MRSHGSLRAEVWAGLRENTGHARAAMRTARGPNLWFGANPWRNIRHGAVLSKRAKKKRASGMHAEKSLSYEGTSSDSQLGEEPHPALCVDYAPIARIDQSALHGKSHNEKPEPHHQRM